MNAPSAPVAWRDAEMLPRVVGAAHRAARWLTEADDMAPRERALAQVVKLMEELGEVAGALIGAEGLNPRKGVTHVTSDVAAELGDVALTALTAVALLGFDPEQVLGATAAKFHERADASDAQRVLVSVSSEDLGFARDEVHEQHLARLREIGR